MSEGPRELIARAGFGAKYAAGRQAGEMIEFVPPPPGQGPTGAGRGVGEPDRPFTDRPEKGRESP